MISPTVDTFIKKSEFFHNFRSFKNLGNQYPLWKLEYRFPNRRNLPCHDLKVNDNKVVEVRAIEDRVFGAGDSGSQYT